MKQSQSELEKNTRVDIVHLREELLFSEGQFFYLLRHFLSSLKLPKLTYGESFLALRQELKSFRSSAKRGEEGLTNLLSYKRKLEKIKRSPFIYFVGLIKAIYCIVFIIPKIIVQTKIKREFAMRIKKTTGYPDIINLGAVPYYFRKLRQQHLVEELGKRNYRIFYIENRFLTRRDHKPGYSITKECENVYIIKLNSLCDVAIYHQTPDNMEIQSIASSLQQLIGNTQIKKAVIKIDHPFWTYLLPYLKYPIIYDCMDDYEGFDITGKHILELEKKLVKQCNLTLVCSDLLLQKIKKFNPKKTLLLKNACDYIHFAKSSEPMELSIPHGIPPKSHSAGRRGIKNKQPVIGFFGAIGEWIDEKLIDRIAKEFSEAKIILIGEVQNNTLWEIASSHNNIKLLGEKPYEILPGYLKTFDVCIIPFKVNVHTTLIDPVKMYEYFASGKPVVTTAITEIKRFEKLMYYSYSHRNFVENIKKALSENVKSLKKQRQKVAYENTWKKRVAVLHEEIQELLNE